VIDSGAGALGQGLVGEPVDRSVSPALDCPSSAVMSLNGTPPTLICVAKACLRSWNRSWPGTPSAARSRRLGR